MNNLFENIAARFRYGERLEPSRDWFVLLTLSIFALALCAVWSISLFGHVARGGTLTRNSTSTPSVFSEASLDAVQEAFAKRQAEAEEYITGAHTFIDPSK